MSVKNIVFFNFEHGKGNAVFPANCPRSLSKDLDECPVIKYCQQNHLDIVILKDTLINNPPKNYKVIIAQTSIQDWLKLQVICRNCKLHTRQKAQERVK